MKTIFRFVGFGVLLAAFIAVGNMDGFAQDPCADAEGQTALSDKVRELFPKKDLESQQAKIDSGKQFLEKYGSCELPTPKEFAVYLNTNIPKWEVTLKNARELKIKNELIAKFNLGLNSKNWDDVFAAGKELLAKYPDEFRAAELVLGSIGLDETAKPVRVTKWNEDTLRYAKMSIADLDAGKTFKSFGVPPFTYKDKDDSIAWMNYTIGYIYFFDKKNKKDGVSYIYKASQLNSATKTNPVVFESIGAFYFDDVASLANEVKVLIDSQGKDDTEAVAQQKVDAIKAKVGMVNGTAERALDAYARAYKLADPVKDKAYRDVQRTTMQKIYSVRYGKQDGFDAWLNAFAPKQLPDPLSKIIPINDPEPVAPVTTTTTTTSTPGTIKPPAATPTKPPATTTTPAKTPVTTTPAKNPVSTTKRPATAKVVVKKPVAKKKGA